MPSTSIWSQYSKSSDAIFFMYLCYLDESGVPEIPGNSTHFVLAGIAIPIERWREADASISDVMAKYGLAGEELHTAWLLRKYLEQSRVDGFGSLDWEERRRHVARLRVAEIHRVRKLGIAKRNAQLKKVYRHTDPYIHLTFSERTELSVEIAQTISEWDWAVLIASCIDKSYFLTKHNPHRVNAFAFSRVILQFAQFLEDAEGFGSTAEDDGDRKASRREFGLVIHDNNPTVALKHTRQMRFIRETLKTNIDRIIETPLFVDSGLTRMIQLADLWGYSLRRYVENGETNLFTILHGKGITMISGVQCPLLRASVHHFADASCTCQICAMKYSFEE